MYAVSVRSGLLAGTHEVSIYGQTLARSRLLSLSIFDFSPIARSSEISINNAENVFVCKHHRQSSHKWLFILSVLSNLPVAAVSPLHSTGHTVHSRPSLSLRIRGSSHDGIHSVLKLTTQWRSIMWGSGCDWSMAARHVSPTSPVSHTGNCGQGHGKWTEMHPLYRFEVTKRWNRQTHRLSCILQSVWLLYSVRIL